MKHDGSRQERRETIGPVAIVSGSAAATRRVGRCLGGLLRPGDLVILKGPFGSGKTTLTQGIALGLGIHVIVTSPSFTLVNQYRNGLTLYHVDLYRISGAAEALDFGLEEYLNERAVCVVEWPESAAEALPSERLEITLGYSGATRRTLLLVGSGARPSRILADFAARCAQPQRPAREKGVAGGSARERPALE